MAVSRILLSQAPNGNLIQVAATAAISATPLHISAASPTIDEMEFWGWNRHTALVVLYLTWGGTDPEDLVGPIELEPAQGPILLCPGLSITNGQTIGAYADVANVVNIGGHGNRITT
jgi:hypothetical protein